MIIFYLDIKLNIINSNLYGIIGYIVIMNNFNNLKLILWKYYWKIIFGILMKLNKIYLGTLSIKIKMDFMIDKFKLIKKNILLVK